MFPLRRAFCRAVRAPVFPGFVQPRSLTTLSRCGLNLNRRIAPANLQQRWLSDEVRSERDQVANREYEHQSPAESYNSEHFESVAGDHASRDSASESPLRFVKPPVRDAPTPKSTIYVGNLFFDVTAEDLKTEFSKFGTVEAARVIYDPRGVSRGFGYLKFSDVETAQKAIALMHGQVFEGRRLAINFAQVDNFVRPTSAPTRAPTRTLFIGNMSFEMTDRDLNELFRDINNVIDVRVAVDRRTGQARGFAHADFVDIESAEIAFDILKHKSPYGRQLRIDYSHSSNRIRSAEPAEPQPEHEPEHI